MSDPECNITSTCEEDEYPYFCQDCKEPSCKCAPIENKQTLAKQNADTSAFFTDQTVPLEEQITAAEKQLSQNILDAKILLRSFVRPLPRSSYWKRKYDTDPEKDDTIDKKYNNADPSQMGLQIPINASEEPEIMDDEQINDLISGFENGSHSVDFSNLSEGASAFIQDILSDDGDMFDEFEGVKIKKATKTKTAAKKSIPKAMEEISSSEPSPIVIETSPITDEENPQPPPESAKTVLDIDQSPITDEESPQPSPDSAKIVLDIDQSPITPTSPGLYIQKRPIMEQRIASPLHEDTLIADYTPPVPRRDRSPPENEVIGQGITEQEVIEQEPTVQQELILQTIQEPTTTFKQTPIMELSDKKTITILKNYQKKFLTIKYLKEHPELTQASLKGNKDFEAFLAKPENIALNYDVLYDIDNRPYAILRNYYTTVLDLDISSPRKFSQLIQKFMELSDVSDAEKFQEIPFSDFAGDISKYITEQDIAYNTYKIYWHDRIRKLNIVYKNDPEKLKEYQDKYKRAEVIWKSNEFKNRELSTIDEYGSSISPYNSSDSEDSEEEPIDMDPTLVVVPTLVGTPISAFAEVNNKTILRLSQVDEPNSNLLDRIKSRWAQILVHDARSKGGFNIKIPSQDYNVWIREKFQEQPVPSITETLLSYYTKVKGLEPGTVSFGKAVRDDYKKLYLETKTPKGSIPFISAEYFPATQEGDQLWKKYMDELGYIEHAKTKDEQIQLKFENNVKKLRKDVYKDMLGSKTSEQNSNQIWEEVASMSLIDLIKYKAKHGSVSLKSNVREFPKKVIRISTRILEGYDPSVIDPLTLSDFRELGIDDSEYTEYMRQRTKTIKEYEASKKTGNRSIMY